MIASLKPLLFNNNFHFSANFRNTSLNKAILLQPKRKENKNRNNRHQRKNVFPIKDYKKKKIFSMKMAIINMLSSHKLCTIGH